MEEVDRRTFGARICGTAAATFAPAALTSDEGKTDVNDVSELARGNPIAVSI